MNRSIAYQNWSSHTAKNLKSPRLTFLIYKYLLTAGLSATLCSIVYAQSPSATVARQDTDVLRSNILKVKKTKVYHIDTAHSPHKAVMRSIAIPGWGQVYNHKIWEVPVIYGTLGLFGWGIVFNAQYYKEFLQLSLYRNRFIVPKPTDPYYAEYNAYKDQVSDQAIYDAKDSYRRNRDLCILGALAFWGINAVDAYIDAKFIHSYTLDNNFSMRVTPGFINQPTIYAQNATGSYIPGIKITFTL